MLPRTAGHIARTVVLAFVVLAFIAALTTITTITPELSAHALATTTTATAHVQPTPSSAVCDTDTSCAAWDAAHGVISDGGPDTRPLHDVAADQGSDVATDQGVTDEDVAGWTCAYEGNFQCGVGSPDGPVLEPAGDGGEAYDCPVGGEARVNAVGVVVCDFSRTV